MDCSSGQYLADKYGHTLHFHLVRDQCMDECKKWLNVKAVVLFSYQIYFGQSEKINNNIMHMKPKETEMKEK